MLPVVSGGSAGEGLGAVARGPEKLLARGERLRGGGPWAGVFARDEDCEAAAAPQPAGAVLAAERALAALGLAVAAAVAVAAEEGARAGGFQCGSVV